MNIEQEKQGKNIQQSFKCLKIPQIHVHKYSYQYIAEHESNALRSEGRSGYSPLIVQVAGKYQKTYNCKTNRKNQQAFVDLS